MSTQHLASNLVVPHGTDIAVFTTSTTDIITTLSNTLQLGTLLTKGQFITVVADGGDVWCFFKATGVASAAAGTISSAASATGSAQRAWLLKDGVPQHFRITKAHESASNAGVLRSRFHHVCSAAGKKIRMYVSSHISTDGIGR